MEILKSKILSLDVSSSVKAFLLNRITKIKGCKVLIDDSKNSIEFVPKYYKEYEKGKNGRYYVRNIINMKWLNIDNRFEENLILVNKDCYLH
ncbi:hypothetical protein [Hyphomonas sp.]|jgi:hypothetical protein|uniref:hypothetical protein n=1 Tax=Hyphomonas sp. TaxID=87 RepID=UPI000C9565EC|nr:hypothetical protein [Hyphomonas sp.]MAL46788.1 hypothetical protein [Hyphomonas sp.]|tara:strand:- start:541 stop:816 length:276 start_codon:yes stop_codon:yes gene_type:complete